MKYREDVVEGLENAPRALIGLLRGPLARQCANCATERYAHSLAPKIQSAVARAVAFEL